MSKKPLFDVREIARQEARRAWSFGSGAFRFLGYSTADITQDIELRWLEKGCEDNPAYRRIVARNVCRDLLESAFRQKRELGQAPKIEKADREEWIFPGIGRENIFSIFRTGDYQGNARFEYDPARDAEEWRAKDASAEDDHHIYGEIVNGN